MGRLPVECFYVNKHSTGIFGLDIRINVEYGYEI